VHGEARPVGRGASCHRSRASSGFRRCSLLSLVRMPLPVSSTIADGATESRLLRTPRAHRTHQRRSRGRAAACSRLAARAACAPAIASP
jgi:hypothetical protein